jgi:hypothetical protein
VLESEPHLSRFRALDGLPAPLVRESSDVEDKGRKVQGVGPQDVRNSHMFGITSGKRPFFLSVIKHEGKDQGRGGPLRPSSSHRAAMYPTRWTKSPGSGRDLCSGRRSIRTGLSSSGSFPERARSGWVFLKETPIRSVEMAARLSKSRAPERSFGKNPFRSFHEGYLSEPCLYDPVMEAGDLLWHPALSALPSVTPVRSRP